MPLFQDKFGSTQQAEQSLIDAFVRRKRRPPVEPSDQQTVQPSNRQPVEPRQPMDRPKANESDDLQRTPDFFGNLLNENEQSLTDALARAKPQPMMAGTKPGPAPVRSFMPAAEGASSGTPIQLERGRIYDKNYNDVTPVKKAGGIYTPDAPEGLVLNDEVPYQPRTPDKFDKGVANLQPDQRQTLESILGQRSIGVTPDMIGEDDKTLKRDLNTAKFDQQKIKDAAAADLNKQKLEQQKQYQQRVTDIQQGNLDMRKDRDKWQQADAFDKLHVLTERLTQADQRIALERDAGKRAADSARVQRAGALRQEAEARRRANTDPYTGEWTSEEAKSGVMNLLDQVHSLIDQTETPTPDKLLVPTAAPEPAGPAQAPKPVDRNSRRAALIQKYQERHGEAPDPELLAQWDAANP